jgi:hypothetical protein
MSIMLKGLSSWRYASRIEKAALWLIAIGFFIPLVIFSGYSLIDWIPLDAPIPLIEGRSSVFHFRANMGGGYRISIRTDKTIPFQVLDCMLGLASGPSKASDCRTTPQVIDLNWKLTRRKDGSVVQQGKYIDSLGGGYSDTTIDAEFAYVRVSRGAYDLEIVPTRDGTALQVAHPRAHFEVDSDYYVGSIILHLLSVIIGVAFIVLGCAIMAVCQWRMKKLHKTSSHKNSQLCEQSPDDSIPS